MFKNVYCAYCNGVRDIHEWKMVLNCDKKSSLSAEDVREQMVDENYDHLKKIWNFYHKSIRVRCHLKIKEFENLKDTLQIYGLRQCKNIINECNTRWKGTKMEEKCLQHNMHVTYRNLKYKNLYCLQCNDIEVNMIRCKALFRRTKKGRFGIRHVFEIDLSKRNSIKKSRGSCRKNEIMNQLKLKCEAMECGRLYMLVDGRCQRNFDIALLNDSLQIACHTEKLMEDQFLINQNGTLWVKSRMMNLDRGEFEIVENQNQSISAIICRHSNYEPIFKFSWHQNILSEICLYISIACLVVHISVYAMIPVLRNLPGKNLLSLSVSLLIAQIIFLYGIERTEIYELCYIHSLVMHYFILTYFFWINIMAIDIYSTFKKTQGRKQANDHRKFVWYSCYAWLSPLIIITVATIVDNTSIVDESFKPGYAIDVCWISHRKALLLFFALPIAIILLVNIILFSMTTFHIRAVSKSTKKVVKGPQKIRLILYVRLAVVMGLTWTVAFIAAFTELLVLNYIYIIFNGLQGAFIFIAFTCKRKIFKQVRKKLDHSRTSFLSNIRTSSRNQSSLSITLNGTESKHSIKNRSCKTKTDTWQSSVSVYVVCKQPSDGDAE